MEKHYQTAIANTLEDLRKEVEVYIDRGYRPEGGITIDRPKKETFFIQVMYKEV